MNEEERYLRAATRGLWGRQRQEVRAELRGHIGVRMQELRLGGLSEPEAERQTLRELGARAEVRTGMLGVHTLPALGKSGLAAMLAATLLIGTLPHGQAQVSSMFGTTERYGASAYLDFGQLQAEIKKAGGKLSGTPGQATLTVPGARIPMYLVSALPNTTPEQEENAYIRASDVLGGLAMTGMDVRIRGWTNPTVQAGKTVIRIQTDDWRVSNSLYGATLQTDPNLQAGSPLTLLEPNGDTREVTLKGDFQAGKVYALVTPTFGLWETMSDDGSVGPKGNILLTVNTNVAQKGQVTFRIYNAAQHFQVVSSVQAMHKTLDPYRKSGKLLTWTASRPAPSVVLALSGHFGPDAYTVVPPQGLRRR